MSLRLRYPRMCALIVGLAMVTGLAATSPARADGPFSALAGSWSGGGKVDFNDGKSERLRCRATYTVGGGGSQVSLTLRCASDSYNFVLTSSLTAQGGSASGNWSEQTRGIGGTVSGTVGGNTMRLQVVGPAFGAGLSLAVNGNKQAISIASAGSQLKGASISLTKGS